MSSASQPISPARFADALRDLPLSSLHAKAAELHNSITHLESSNEQLRPFAVDGDVDCYEAIMENREVITRMRERIELLRKEVEERGMLWVEPGEKRAENGEDPVVENGTGAGGDGAQGAGRDEELRRRMEERERARVRQEAMRPVEETVRRAQEESGEDEEGVFL